MVIHTCYHNIFQVHARKAFGKIQNKRKNNSEANAQEVTKEILGDVGGRLNRG
jgi:hypothetical protein